MAVPNYGATPLSKTFLILRAFQLVCFLGIVGMTANFVAEIVSSGATAPSEIIGTLIITSIATLYCLLSLAFFWAPANIGLLVMCGLDFLLLIAFTVVAVVLGKPLSYLDCFIIGNASASVNAASALSFTQSVGSNMNKNRNFVSWTGATKTNCFESKSIWGLSIALCILFTCSFLVLPALFAKQKRASQRAAKMGA